MMDGAGFDREKDFEETKHLTENVDGWLRGDEGACLYEFASQCKGLGAIVEIGSWKGRSTIWLGRGSISAKKTKVYAVDPHTGSTEHREFYGKVSTYDEFMKNIDEAGLSSLVIPLVMSSKEAASRFTGPVEFIFIDGEHNYESVKSDFEEWSPKVIDGGYILFHDSAAWSGVLKAVRELVYSSRKFKVIKIVFTITVAQKVEQLNLFDKYRNKFLFCYLLLCYGTIIIQRSIHGLFSNRQRK